jgi:hypothetical protein
MENIIIDDMQKLCDMMVNLAFERKDNYDNHKKRKIHVAKK